MAKTSGTVAVKVVVAAVVDAMDCCLGVSEIEDVDARCPVWIACVNELNCLFLVVSFCLGVV